MTDIGFIGLGAMGYPMAGHLVAAGHSVSVYNRTTEVADRFVAEFPDARLASSPAEACRGAAVGVMIVGNDDSVRSVALGDDGALAGLAEGSVLIDHTTASATMAAELAEAAGAKNISTLDAPVSGGEAGAQNGVHRIESLESLERPNGRKDNEKTARRMARQRVLRAHPDRFELLGFIGHRLLPRRHSDELGVAEALSRLHRHRLTIQTDAQVKAAG